MKNIIYFLLAYAVSISAMGSESQLACHLNGGRMANINLENIGTDSIILSQDDRSIVHIKAEGRSIKISLVDKNTGVTAKTNATLSQLQSTVNVSLRLGSSELDLTCEVL